MKRRKFLGITLAGGALLSNYNVMNAETSKEIRQSVRIKKSGKYSRNIIDSSRDAGLKIGFTTEGIKNYLPMKLQSDDIMTIGRFTIRNDIPLLGQLKKYRYDNVLFNKYMHIKKIVKKVM